MMQPPGFAAPGCEDWVCLLKKALYGLKQAGCQWYACITDAFLRLGYTRCETEHCVFVRWSGSKFTAIVVAVDDLTIVVNSVILMEDAKRELELVFKITDLGEVHWLLGIEITRNRSTRTISLSQTAYIDAITSHFNLDNARTVSMPMDPGITLSIAQCPNTLPEVNEMKNVPYKAAIGSLMYAALGTHPDIAFSVSLLGQFMHNPGRTHWEAAKRMLRYLKGSRNLKLTFGSTSEGIIVYLDVDLTSQEHRHSISGFACLINGGAVSWSSKKQSVIALSTTEAEYISATNTTKEICWIRALLAEVIRPLAAPTILYNDNQLAIALTKDNQFHARTKHIDICFHFIHEAMERGVLTLVYCPTDNMVADVLTEALPHVKIMKLSRMLGLGSGYCHLQITLDSNAHHFLHLFQLNFVELFLNNECIDLYSC